MKKKIYAILMMVALLALTGCGDANEKENAKDSGAKVEDVTNGTQESIGKKTTAEDIEIVKEYLYADGFGSTYHFVVVKNNGATPVAIKTSTKAYKNDGSSLDVDQGIILTLGSGATTVYFDIIRTDEEITKCDVEVSVEDSIYKCGISSLKYEKIAEEYGITLKITNSGEKDVDFVEGYALFIKDGKLVDWKSSYGGKMEPGKTIDNKLTTFKEYDDIEIYLTGGIM